MPAVTATIRLFFRLLSPAYSTSQNLSPVLTMIAASRRVLYSRTKVDSPHALWQRERHYYVPCCYAACFPYRCFCAFLRRLMPVCRVGCSGRKARLCRRQCSCRAAGVDGPLRSRGLGRPANEIRPTPRATSTTPPGNARPRTSGRSRAIWDRCPTPAAAFAPAARLRWPIGSTPTTR